MDNVIDLIEKLEEQGLKYFVVAFAEDHSKPNTGDTINYIQSIFNNVEKESDIIALQGMLTAVLTKINDQLKD